MQEEKNRLVVEQIGDGALLEQANTALAELVKDIADVNTTTKARKLTITVSLKPTDDRTFMGISGKVATTFGDREPVEGTADIGLGPHGGAVAFHRAKRQQDIPFNVKRINQGGQ